MLSEAAPGNQVWAAPCCQSTMMMSMASPCRELALLRALASEALCLAVPVWGAGGGARPRV